ncbi:MAG: hypothetical protein LBL45_03790, partial [Treponema sp.]|nr:hypothetical protein [Treponema sp.]
RGHWPQGLAADTAYPLGFQAGAAVRPGGALDRRTQPPFVRPPPGARPDDFPPVKAFIPRHSADSRGL